MQKYITDFNALSRLSKEIVRAHPRGYRGVVVEGPRGGGKTVFCLKTQREVYQYHFGITRDDAWERVLNELIFDLNDIIKLLEPLDDLDDYKDKMSEWWTEKVCICKMWDDAGMHGGKYMYHVAPLMVNFLQQNLDVFRFIVTGFLINGPELGNFLKFMREYHDHTIIKITHNSKGIGPYEKVAYFQRWKRLRNRNGYALVKNPPHQPFSCFLGDVDRLGLKEQWVYDRYEFLKGCAIRRNRDVFKKIKDVAEKCTPEEEVIPPGYLDV